MSNITYGIIKGVLIGLIIFCFQYLGVLPSRGWFSDIMVDVVSSVFVCIVSALLFREEPIDGKQQ